MGGPRGAGWGRREGELLWGLGSACLSPLKVVCGTGPLGYFLLSYLLASLLL